MLHYECSSGIMSSYCDAVEISSHSLVGDTAVNEFRVRVARGAIASRSTGVTVSLPSIVRDLVTVINNAERSKLARAQNMGNGSRGGIAFSPVFQLDVVSSVYELKDVPFTEASP
jgi:hypothetical protein